jgi:hypothetical protein
MSTRCKIVMNLKRGLKESDLLPERLDILYSEVVCLLIKKDSQEHTLLMKSREHCESGAISFFPFNTKMTEAETELVYEYDFIIDSVMNNKKLPQNVVINDLVNKVTPLLLAECSLLHIPSTRPVVISGNQLFLRI